MSPTGAGTSPEGAHARESRRLVVIAGLAAALAVVLGAVGLADASLWLDETFSVFDARRDLVDILAMRGEAFGGAHHPPGYFLLLKGTMAICGAHEVCVRAPSVLGNAGIAAVLVWIAGRWFGLVPAAAAGVMWASTPYAIKYAQQARHYTLLALVAAVALLLLVRVLGLWRDAADKPSDRTFWALGLVASAGLWLHLFALPMLGALVLLGALAVATSADRSRLPTLRQWMTAAGVAVVASAPLLPGLWRVWVTGGGGQLASKAGPVENARELLVDLATFGLDTVWIPVLCACALLVPTWRGRAQALALAVLAALPMSVVFVRNPEHFVALRYFMPSLVPVALLVGMGVGAVVDRSQQLARRVAPRRAAVLGASLAAVLLAVPVARIGALHVAGLRKQWATAGFEPWRDVSAAIRDAAGEGDVAVLVPFELVEYPLLVYPPSIPTVAPDELEAALAERPPGVFVVTSHIDRPERSAARREVLRRVAGAGYVRTELDGVPAQRAIEVLLYRPRR